MIDLETLGFPAAFAMGTAIAGWMLGRRSARLALAEAIAEASKLGLQRDSAERRAREALGECERWRGMSLAPTELSREPLLAGRPAPRDAELLANLIRGLVLVDDVVITDRSALPLTRETDGGSAGLAAVGALAAELARRLTLLGVPVVQLAVETFTADHLCVRALPGRGEGAVLVVKTTSQPVSPLAVDAVVHAAARHGGDVAASPPVLAMRGTAETKTANIPALADLFRDLGQEVRGDLSGIMLTSGESVFFAAVKDGPAASIRSQVAAELARIQARASLLLRGAPIARVEAVLKDGSRIGWAVPSPRSRVALMTFGRADARLLARLAGRLRRAMNDHGSLEISTQENAA